MAEVMALRRPSLSWRAENRSQRQPLAALLSVILTDTSYRLDSRDCDGYSKNSDEKQVTVSKCKATTKTCEQGKPDQFPQARRHSDTASGVNCQVI